MFLPGLALLFAFLLSGDAPGTGTVLERLFGRHEVSRVHLADPGYRARFEAMSPEQVTRFLPRVRDAAVGQYLREVLGFTRSLSALRQAPGGERPSVTFIMGDLGDRFYANADRFYRLNEEERTEYVILSLRSLEEVRDWLEENLPRPGLPWGVVNIVVHTYQWGGLSVPVMKGGTGRTDKVSLYLAMRDSRFSPLPDSVVDVRTDIRIQGCALGRDRKLLALLCEAFGGRDPQRPALRSSKYFVFYETTWRNRRPVAAHQYLAEYWHVPHSLYSRPGDAELVRRFEKRYPDEDLDWRAALGRARPRLTGDAYSHSYNVPVSWLVVYDDTAGRRAGRQPFERVLEQEALVAHLGDLGLSPDEFRWVLTDTILLDEHGVQRATLIIEGLGSVMCVQREMAEPDPDRPGTMRRVRPPVTDTSYYGAEVPAREPAALPGFNIAFEPW